MGRRVTQGEVIYSMMPDTTHDIALHAAERLREAVCNLRLAHGAVRAGKHVTLSLGVATEVPMDEMSSDSLVTRADQALYAAKHSGRDRVISSERALAAFAQGTIPPAKRKARNR